MTNIQTKTTMRMAHFHDFYFLQAIKAGTVTGLASNPELEFSKSVEKFLDDFEKTEEAMLAAYRYIKVRLAMLS